MAKKPNDRPPRKPWRMVDGMEIFPCIVHSIPKDHELYAKGIRFHVHDIDDDIFYFHDLKRMIEVLEIHNMQQVPVEEMEQIRLLFKNPSS